MVKLWALTQKLEGSSADSVREKKKKKKHYNNLRGWSRGVGKCTIYRKWLAVACDLWHLLWWLTVASSGLWPVATGASLVASSGL